MILTSSCPLIPSSQQGPGRADSSEEQRFEKDLEKSVKEVVQRQGSVGPRGHATCFLGGIGEGAHDVAAQMASITSLWGHGR